jgi:hypothetical protein
MAGGHLCVFGASEGGVENSPEEQNYFTPRRNGVEDAKKTGQSSPLCVLAPRRELFDFSHAQPCRITGACLWQDV